MKENTDFLVRQVEVKTPKEHEMEEMRSDISAFSPAARAIVEKYLDNRPLAPEEAKIFRDEREKWWSDKYGFSYNFSAKSVRSEVLRKKYAPPEELARANELQERMFAAIAQNSPDAEKLKQEYLECYPDQLEGIEIIFGIRPFLELSRKMDTEEIPYAERIKILEEITEYQFLLTHFVQSNGQDKKFLALFWNTLEKIASQSELSRQLNIIRRGIITQVATFRMLEAAGTHPRLSHPSEDAFKSVDLWSDRGYAVQIKGTPEMEPRIMETDEIGFPGAETQSGHYNSHLFAQAQRFKMKVARDGKKGYFIVTPYSKVDFVTGEPDKELIDFAKRKLGNA
jgi:hypothetical protein